MNDLDVCLFPMPEKNLHHSVSAILKYLDYLANTSIMHDILFWRFDWITLRCCYSRLGCLFYLKFDVCLVIPMGRHCMMA